MAHRRGRDADDRSKKPRPTNIPRWQKCCGVFGSRQIRNRATLGGNLVTASPIGDTAPVLLSLRRAASCSRRRKASARAARRVLPRYRKTALQRRRDSEDDRPPARRRLPARAFLQSLEAARDGHQHRRRLLRARSSTTRAIVRRRAARVWRRRADAGRARENRGSAASAKRGTRKRWRTCAADSGARSSRRSPTCAAARTIARGLIVSLSRNSSTADDRRAKPAHAAARRATAADRHAGPHESAHKHVTGEADLRR